MLKRNTTRSSISQIGKKGLEIFWGRISSKMYKKEYATAVVCSLHFCRFSSLEFLSVNSNDNEVIVVNKYGHRRYLESEGPPLVRRTVILF